MKKKLIFGGIIVILTGLIIFANIKKSEGNEGLFSSNVGTSVEVSKIKKEHFKSTITNTGVVKEVEYNNVYFEDSVRVTQIHFEEFDKITKGTKVIDIDLSTLEKQLNQLKITLTNQELELSKTKNINNSRGKSDITLAISTSKNNLESAKENYQFAQKDFDEAVINYSKITLTKDDLKQFKKNLLNADIAFKNAKLNYENTLETQRKYNINTNTSVKTQENNIESTKLNISDVEKKIESLNEKCLSPISGVISNLPVLKGALINLSQPAFRIVNMDKLKVIVNIKEFDINNIAVGQTVSIYGDAIDKESNVTGKVSKISPIAKTSATSTGKETTVEVVISVDYRENLGNYLSPGLNAECEILVQENKEAITVSYEMISQDKDGNEFVYVVDEKENIIKKRNIKLGLSSELNAEVLEGISVGEVVLSKIENTFKDGMKVKYELLENQKD